MRKYAPLVVVILIALVPFSIQATESSESFLWHIRKNHWAAEDEKNYQTFVHALGETRCNTVTNCLSSPANPYLKTRPKLPPLSVDCSKLPYFIRAYFAWANDLPFSFVSQVRGLRQGGADLRYSKSGNEVVARTDILSEPGKAPNIIKVLNYLNNYVDSSVYRIDPASETTGHYSDFYPVKLTPASIRPGTLFYDVDGHLVLVYQVEKDGRILYMDSHPDNSLTRGTYGAKFMRSNPRMGGGFKNWRPVFLEGASADQNGNFVGGKIDRATNEKIADYSLEQYMGTQPDPAGDWKKGIFVYQGKTLPYLEYLRAALSGGVFKLNPVTEFANSLKELCGYLNDRVASVDQAVKAGLDRVAHPESIPTNIFGAQGDWETYSTASRDLRVRTMFRDIVAATGQMISRQASHDPTVDYQGSDLKADLAQTYKAQVASCVITYTNSVGQPRPLTLDDIRTRVFDMSFDPYDCVERRWGDTNNQELATCKNSHEKESWYAREKKMRRLQTRVPNIDDATGADFLSDADVDIVKVIN